MGLSLGIRIFSRNRTRICHVEFNVQLRTLQDQVKNYQFFHSFFSEEQTEYFTEIEYKI